MDLARSDARFGEAEPGRSVRRLRARYIRFMDTSDPDLRRERWKLTARLMRSLERPMLVLSGVWLLLLILEFTRGLSPWLQSLNTVIWLSFIGQFAMEFMLAPRKGVYLRKRWLTALSLALPALRLLRLVRLARAARLAPVARGVRLARLLSAVNRGMRALAAGFRRRGLGYVVVLTALVCAAGSAGMYQFELDAPGGPGFADYGTALWWTAMLLTTMGSDYWPRTAEGRVLCLLIAVYAFAVFGYVTAAIAAYFVGKDKDARSAAEPSP
jgi:voltage-gated potassium channel